MSSLIPRGEEYLKHNMNVLLVGKHGTGKTESVLALANQLGLKLKYYSCSTLDPYTDLIGIPTPRQRCTSCELWFREEDTCLNCHSPTIEALKMIRPIEIDEAEFIFFDEFNRAEKQTMQAIFEIIQFGSINGEPLPNLRCCWAAMNPPGDEYQVEELDPALVDRFDAYITVEAQPSVAYMVKHGISKPVAQALVEWWKDHHRQAGEKHFISPRRLMKVARAHRLIGISAIRNALPDWGDYPIGALSEKLRVAEGRAMSTPSGSLASPISPDFSYDPETMLAQRASLINHLEDNPHELATHQRVIEGLEGILAGRLVKEYGPILEVIMPALRESYLNKLSKDKREAMLEILHSLKAEGVNLENLEKDLINANR